MGLAAAVTLAACGPTYPQGRVAAAVVEICRREFQLAVQARIDGPTLAVLFEAHHLFEGPAVIAPDTDLTTLNQAVHFSAEGMEAFQHVSLAVRRVVISTDAPLQFYLIIIRDADAGQVELRWLGHILDLKRLNAYDISQGDFLKYRAVIHFRAVPIVAAVRTVRQLYQDLQARAPVGTIARHFAPRADLRSLLPFLLRHVVPAAGPGDGIATLAEVTGRPLDDETVLVFARTLVPTDGVPPVREQADLFVVSVRDVRGTIERVIPLPMRQPPQPALGRWVAPAEFVQYGAPDRWAPEALFVEPMDLPTFLAEQMARRVRVDWGDRPGMAGLAVAAEYAAPAFHVQFRLGGPAGAARAVGPAPGTPVVPDPTTPEGFAAVVARTAAEVVRNYDFRAFERVTITDVQSGVSWSVPADRLPRYRHRAVPPLSQAAP